MTSTMDYSALRALAQDAGDAGEAVTVNTRALIDKVLARYSGEWTTLRELIQNASDASASKVTIRFETSPSTTVPAPSSVDSSVLIKHVCLHHTLKRLVVSNDGHPFQPSDWSRLKRIAEGNPDETKIGAFGVGFYSVFADCEEPLVRSGSEALAFYWKSNALFTRRLPLPPEQKSSSDDSQVPRFQSLVQFLTTSITFIGLQTIELWLDDWNILSVVKKAAPSLTVAIPKDIQTRTPEKIMNVIGVQRELVQLDARWLKIVGWNPPKISSFGSSPTASGTDTLKNFFSRFTATPSNTANKSLRVGAPICTPFDEQLTATSTSTIFLHITNADLRTSVSVSFADELERATKKKAPQHTKIAILTPLWESVMPTETSHPVNIFGSILPTKSGKVFIGFPTAQTTGILAHVSAPSVIPTVERESIDFNARYIRTWNVELLRAAGIVCRIAWACEMNSAKQKLTSHGSGSTITDESVAKLLPDVTHTFGLFAFHESTPSSQLGEILEEAFWTAGKQASIDIFSSQGVLPCHEVRVGNDELSGFMQGIPVVPDKLLNGAKPFIAKLREFGLLTEITTGDVRRELEKKPLNETQLREFLHWAGTKTADETISVEALRSMTDVAVASIEDRIVQLSELKFFLNISVIPANLPYPPSTAPYSCTKTLPKAALQALGWEELQIVPWLRFLVENTGGRGMLPTSQDLTVSASFSAQVLPVLSKCWDALSQSSKLTIQALLQSRTVIPTKMGMKPPGEAYFPTVRLFPDLPLVTGLNNVKEKFLLALGVRKTIELSVIFERLDNGSPEASGTWSHADLIRYLASVSQHIPRDDIQRLKIARIYPAEHGQDPTKPTTARYTIAELFEPKETVRNLGLLLLQWPRTYHPGSKEGAFLTSMGLRSAPSALDLIKIMAEAPSRGDMNLYDRALAYYISNYDQHGYSKTPGLGTISEAYLPVQRQDAMRLAAPGDCFLSERAPLFGYHILRLDLHPHAPKFGVAMHPPIAGCVTRLLRAPPQTKLDASTKFAYLGSRFSEISDQHLERLKNAPIVPIFPESSKATGNLATALHPLRFRTPQTCYIGSNNTYDRIFDFVDFGPEASAFLIRCGSKSSPNTKEVAAELSRGPARILATLGTSEKYLDLLRTLAMELSDLRKDPALFRQLKNAPWLLAYKETAGEPHHNGRQSMLSSKDDAEDEYEGTSGQDWQLATAAQIAMLDSLTDYDLFKAHLLIAPQEDLLEGLYHALGSPLLSSLIHEDPRVGLTANEQESAAKLQKLVYERVRLFLHEQNEGAVKHDARWVEKNLRVEAVTSISLRRTLKSRAISITEDRTAVLTNDKQRGCVLRITTGTYDIYQVSQALVQLLIVRPKSHATLLLEFLLSTNLHKLRRRGYNVDRILRAKAAEARIAEDKRRQLLDKERKMIEEQAKALEAGQSTMIPGSNLPTSTMTPGPKEQDHLPIPGSFTVTPEQETSREADSRVKKPKGIFGSITRRFGMDDTNSAPGQPTQNSDRDKSIADSSVNQPPQPVDPGPQEVVAPHALQNELVKAVKASRAHESSSLFSRPQQNYVVESHTYCDSSPGLNMSYMAETSSGIKVYVSNKVQNKPAFAAAHTSALDVFALILIDCGDIFGVPRTSLHIFYDDGGTTIAFNEAGSLFCNFLFFEKLHLPGILQSPQSRHPQPPQASSHREPGPQLSPRDEAVIYWFVTLGHELAHNLVGPHGSDHSYWQ
ncbi:MAG: hypothetical protein M1826_002688 [Phylliscum demangeonii]|nr:MAG: hypothetical protein M1826_002688 [Phylliscum demangeonii]